MIVSLMLLASLQIGIDGRSMRKDGGYELTINGGGEDLKDRESLILHFHRIVNRVDARTGAIGTIALNEPWCRSVTVRDGQFQHVEPFSSPGSVQVLLSIDEFSRERMTITEAELREERDGVANLLGTATA